MKKNYTHIFFDLDHTLWDFAKNSEETLIEALNHFELFPSKIPDKMAFIKTYYQINDWYWEKYRHGLVTKEQLRVGRFEKAFNHFGITDTFFADAFATYYLEHSPKKTNLFPNVHETLDYLKSKYKLSIITNGFQEVQYIKLEKSQLATYFEFVVTSEQVGVKKPDNKIFRHALQLAQAKPQNSLMVGDNFMVDIVGARKVGMDQAYFNPDKLPYYEPVTYNISNLLELKNIL